ncbi:transposase [Defluviitalea saccharophila]|uniref:Transposase n=1 Tax=Defluviitalea saccharophila TaxID=879970 RepID=A0ABZ2Y2Q4_9FIRM
MIITRKIELAVIGTEEEKQASWELIRYYHNIIPQLNNFIITQIFLNNLIEEKFAVHDKIYTEKINLCERKISELYNKLKRKNQQIKEIVEEDQSKKEKLIKEKETILKDIEKLKKKKSGYFFEGRTEARNKFKEIYNVTLQGSINQMIRSIDHFADIPDTIISPAISELSFYKNEIYKIKLGESSIRYYKKGMPFNTRGRDLKFEIQDKDIYIRWVKGIKFKLIFGRDRSNNKAIVDKILSEEYKVCDSKIQLKDKKLFLLLCVDIPDNVHVLDEDKVLGVDLGIKVPAYISVNEGYFRQAIGNVDEFLKIRMQMQRRRRQLQKALKYTSGGKGRKKKLKALDTFEETEANWVRTYNHKLSKAIVEAALKQNCKTINLEFLKGYGEKETNKFILRNWSYYQLQQFIEYKAKRYGIDVRYIDPYHSSQTCSECGHYEEGQRIDQETFICKKCGFKDNADYNASKNIAKSTKYVQSKYECEYFKNHNSVDV